MGRPRLFERKDEATPLIDLKIGTLNRMAQGFFFMIIFVSVWQA
jgi:hypothetical protein